MLQELDRLAERVCQDLQRRGASGRTVGIKVRLEDFTTYTRDRTLDHRTSDQRLVAQVARDLLLAEPPQRPVRLVGVRVSGLDGAEDEGEQLLLFP